MNDLERFLAGLNDPENREEIAGIVAAALRVKRAYYDQEDLKPFMFRLRKAIEGVWDTTPELTEFGELP